MTTASLILRTLNESLYHRFAQGEVSDANVADALFDIPSIAPLRWKEAGILFQNCLTQAHKKLTGDPQKTLLEQGIDEYIKAEPNKDRRYDLEDARDRILPYQKHRDTFRIAHQHIELFSSSLTRHRGTS